MASSILETSSPISDQPARLRDAQSIRLTFDLLQGSSNELKRNGHHLHPFGIFRVAALCHGGSPPAHHERTVNQSERVSPLELKTPRGSGWELRAPIDQRTMDAEGGRAVRRSGRVGRLAVVVAVQNLLVVACLLVTVYLYLESLAVQPKDPVYIQFETHAALRSDTHLELKTDRENKLQNNNGNVTISCTGPYVWHMRSCYEKMGNSSNVSGNLTLLVKRTLPVSSFAMNATQERVCRGLQSIVYLVAEDVIRFRFSSEKGFRMLNVSMGLSYLLGNKCEY
ncbi:uncharacterized protein LOC129369377 [Poeciliopsis prolifica]|uniref:uncharacterized protein LOC129369377 n=1 Tax=Poeciliopsis prolifica TaxID=188132 RepID=UPI002413A38E|nr:uncharacterized protein LOC129369377 [Poeciliopsis prolifica]